MQPIQNIYRVLPVHRELSSKPNGGGLDRESWDFVITVCDRAKEACPVFPGQPILSHWGMPDPAAVEGDEVTKRAAFVEALTLISRRIDLLLAWPVEKLERLILEAKVNAIGEVGLSTSAVEQGRAPS